MTVVRRKLLALSIMLPMLAIAAFTLATPLQASCEPGPSTCCYGTGTYSLGSCLNITYCFYQDKCMQGAGYAYWDLCNC